MRIGGEAPRRRTHSRNRFQNHGLLRVTATSDRHRTLTMFCSSASETLSFQVLSLTPLAIRRQPEPRQWLPDATRQLAICAPELRLLFCGFCHPQFESDTTGPMHCVLLKEQKAPSQLNHSAAYSCVARLGEPFLP